jgi:hypothetical protein
MSTSSDNFVSCIPSEAEDEFNAVCGSFKRTIHDRESIVRA